MNTESKTEESEAVRSPLHRVIPSHFAIASLRLFALSVFFYFGLVLIKATRVCSC